MEINGVEVRQATNDEVTVGVISEYDIRIKECVRECEIDGEPTKVNTAWIGGTMNVDVNGDTIKHTFRYLDTIRHKKNGDENKVFKGILTSLGYDVSFNSDTKKLEYSKIDGDNGLVPKIEGKITWLDSNGNKINEVNIKRSGEPTRVKVTSKLSLQEGLNKDHSDLAFYNELPVSYISTTNVPDEDSARFTIEGVVKEIADEYNSSGATTGRYLVDLVVPNFFGVDVFPFVMLDKWCNTIEDEEIEITKEMFYVPNSEDSFCQLGDTVKLSGNVEGHSFGSVQAQSSAKKTFGGGSQNVRQGFTRIEWTIKAGDIVEGEDKYDLDTIKVALNERDIILDNNYKKRLEDYNNSQNKDSVPKSSPKGSASGTSPFGNSAPKSSPFGGGTTKQNPFSK